MRLYVGSSSLLASLLAVATWCPLAVNVNGASYEVWGSDQSNSVPDQTALGVRGSWLWIWDDEDVESIVAGSGSSSPVTPKPCSPGASEGPCDLNTIFPGDLVDASGSGEKLSDASGFGRWHGITKDPQNKYVTANIFAPGGGYLGIVDTETKGAVGLFRVTLMTYNRGDSTTATTRNVHMSFWNADGSAILIHNLAGKAVERINVVRDVTGTITSLEFDKSATVGMGKGMQVQTEASYFTGSNAFGVPLLGGVTGSYDDADLGDLTPTGHCKENGCVATGDEAMPGRPNNVPICPVMASNGLVFNTFGGGGLLILDSTKTPMTIVGAYGNSIVYGAGVCGDSVADKVYFTGGCSASGAGADQSMWALYAFDPMQFSDTGGYQENTPAPGLLFDFEGTATGGRTNGAATDDSGQVPGTTTRRDAHDLTGTIDGKYVHVIDRIKNVVDVFDAQTDTHLGEYDLTTETGVTGDGTTGPCGAASISDGGAGFPLNDPAPDFISATPDGEYMMISFRGPAPVSAGHAAQGSCPGVGIVKLSDGGKSGALVGVLRSTNTVPDNLAAGAISPTGGVTYDGMERSDVHDVVVVFKMDDTEEPTGSPVAAPTPAPTHSPSDAPTDSPTTDTSAASSMQHQQQVGVVGMMVTFVAALAFLP